MSAFVAEAAHWSIALVPVLVLLGVFVWLDAFRLMNVREILSLLLLGAIGALVSWPISGRLLDTLPIGFSIYSRFVAPFVEEAIKAAAMILLFRLNRIGYKLDAVISGFAIGAGFSVVENIFYLTMSFYYFYVFVALLLALPVVYGRQLQVSSRVAPAVAQSRQRLRKPRFDPAQP